MKNIFVLCRLTKETDLAQGGTSTQVHETDTCPTRGSGAMVIMDDESRSLSKDVDKCKEWVIELYTDEVYFLSSDNKAETTSLAPEQEQVDLSLTWNYLENIDLVPSDDESHRMLQSEPHDFISNSSGEFQQKAATDTAFSFSHEENANVEPDFSTSFVTTGGVDSALLKSPIGSFQDE